MWPIVCSSSPVRPTGVISGRLLEISEPGAAEGVASGSPGRDRATMAFMTTASALVLDGREIDPAKLAEVCERYGLAELSVFGSVARGDAGPGSDVDLLFALAPDARLGFALFNLEDELVEIFGRPVDLLPKDSVHRLLRDEVLAEAKVLYAA